MIATGLVLLHISSPQMKDALFQAYGGAAFTHSSGGGLLKPGDFHGQAALLIKEHVRGDERAQQKALRRLMHPEKGNAIVRQTLTCLEREIACSQPTIPSGLKRTGCETDSDNDDEGEPSVLLHPQEFSGADILSHVTWTCAGPHAHARSHAHAHAHYQE